MEKETLESICEIITPWIFLKKFITFIIPLNASNSIMSPVFNIFVASFIGSPAMNFIEGVLESMAEYYSVELSQKIHRGMELNAEKCLSNGSNPGLGFKVNKEDKTFYVDEEEAAIVREIFERYAHGESIAELHSPLQRRKWQNSEDLFYAVN